MSKTFSFQAIQFSQTVLILTIQFSISMIFVYTQLLVKTVLFPTIQFSVIMQYTYRNISIQASQFNINTQFSSIWPIKRTLSGATTSGQSRPGIYRTEGVHHIPQSCSIPATSSWDSLMSYLGHSFFFWGGEGLTLSAEVQLVYSTSKADWAI